jgi:hypothetical protein
MLPDNASRNTAKSASGSQLTFSSVLNKQKDFRQVLTVRKWRKGPMVALYLEHLFSQQINVRRMPISAFLLQVSDPTASGDDLTLSIRVPQ